LWAALIRGLRVAFSPPPSIENGAGELTQLTYELAGQLVVRELHDGSVPTYEHDSRG
jgi:YD repeat-containing protein